MDEHHPGTCDYLDGPLVADFFLLLGAKSLGKRLGCITVVLQFPTF